MLPIRNPVNIWNNVIGQNVNKYGNFIWNLNICIFAICEHKFVSRQYTFRQPSKRMGEFFEAWWGIYVSMKVVIMRYTCSLISSDMLTNCGQVVAYGQHQLRMAHFLMTLSHYLSRCWLIINQVCGIHFGAISQDHYIWYEFENLKLQPHLPGANEVNSQHLMAMFTL